jgi:tRNA modification GTPase
VAITDAAGGVIDQVLLTAFRGPHSYTGEDTVEVSTHGGTLVSRAVLSRLLECGARAAEAGEFTQRAWLNGKLDLTQAEAVMDVISAQTDLALRAAQRQLDGTLGTQIQALRDDVLGLVAQTEAHIDFPEEDITPETHAQLATQATMVIAQIDQLLATASQGRILREGLRTAIVGAPNVGKSSLLNYFLGSERAIVSATPGTTRDTIEEVISLRGIPVRLIDTAGLRATDEPIEYAGVLRSEREIAQADLVIEVIDVSRPASEHPTLDVPAGAHRVLVHHKSDLAPDPSWAARPGIAMSSQQRIGMEALTDHLHEILSSTAGGLGQIEFAVSARHAAGLARARAALEAAQSQLAANVAPEFVALDLREALEALGGIVGHAQTEDILGAIFARFCIGK